MTKRVTENFSATPAGEIEIRRIDSVADIATIAMLHARIFSKLLSGRLGTRFLRFYFTRILHSPAGVIYACTVGNTIVGFVAGVSSKKRLYTVGFMLAALSFIMLRISYRPFIFLKLLRSLLKIIKLQKGACDAELLSIAIEEPYRKQGIGKTLVDRLEEFLRSKGIDRYEVFTHMEPSGSTQSKLGVPNFDFRSPQYRANNQNQVSRGTSTAHLFYERLGFKLRQEVILFGLRARVYLKTV